MRISSSISVQPATLFLMDLLVDMHCKYTIDNYTNIVKYTILPLDLFARPPPSDQLQSLTLHYCVFHDNRVSPLAANECSGSGLVVYTPRQVVNGVLHTAPTEGDVDWRLREHSVLH